MKRHVGKLILALCNLCLAFSLFITPSSISIVLFGEPPFPYE